MGTLTHDIRQAWRTLRRQPGYALLVVLVLALGIGANTAIFSVIHGVLLRELPYEHGDRIVVLEQSAPKAGLESQPFSVLELRDVSRAPSLDGLVEYHSMWFNLLGGEEPERVQTGVVSAEFFEMLGVRPLLGRTFLPHEDDPGAEPVLVISHSYWQRSLGSDPRVVGRTFEMNDRVHTVVGVLPPIPGYPDDNDVWMPISACPFRADPAHETNRQMRMLTAVARLEDGVSLERARSDLAAVAAVQRREHPETYLESQGHAVGAEPLREELTRRARPTFLLLLATSGLVLLIACGNVANLAFARLLRRERELAVRAALGAGRGRLVRQLLTESALLGLVGGVIGLALAAGALDLLVSFAGRFTPRAGEIRIDPAVLAFTLVVSLATGLVFGALPALASPRDLVPALKEGGARATAGGGRLRLRGGLIVGQLALSFVLLAAAGLMLRSLVRLQNVDPGFDPLNVLTATVDLDWSRYARGHEADPQAMVDFYRPLLDRLAVEPGVVAAGVGATFPLSESAPFNANFRVEGRPAADGAGPVADFQVASAGWFDAVDVPLLSGRMFRTTDALGEPYVVLVSRSLARRHWGDEDPVGRRISSDGGETWDTVIGVVGDVRQHGLDQEPVETIYYSYFQNPLLSTSVVLRTTGDPRRLGARIREEVRRLDPDQPVADVRTLEEVRSGSLAPPRLTALLLGLFAALALVIAAAGIGGVLAFAVTQRTHEIGIRVALGAQPSAVVVMVTGQVAAMVAAGLVLGLAGAIALGRLMTGLLYEVRPTDPGTLALVSLVLAAVAMAACLGPVRRATAIPPLLALRAE